MHPISRVELAPAARRYVNAHEKRWSKSWHYRVHLLLRHLRHWLKKENLNFRNLTPAHIEKFLKEESSPTKTAGDNMILRSYIRWLVEHNGLQVNFYFLFPDYPRWNPALPRFAQEYLDFKTPQLRCRITKTTVRRVVTRFHRWLRGARMSVKDLKREDLDKFLKDYSQRMPYSASTHHTFRSFLRLYLDWLVDRGHMQDIDLSILFPRGKDKSYRRLTPRAKRFLATLPATRAKKTCFQYKAALCEFYSFLHERHVKECHISRRHIEIWLSSLESRGLKPMSRAQYIIRVRSHLEWMAEHGNLKKDPRHLIRICDILKCSKLLPRPFPPDLDREIQNSLCQSEDLFSMAVLLLRRTGIRIGELINLPWDCVKKDHNGNWSLKVPLGKMQNERLIPLGDDTVTLLKKIQTESRKISLESDRLIPNRFKDVTLYCKLRDVLRNIAKDLNTREALQPHRMRHSFATELLNGGMSLYSLMTLLGHRSIITTQIYAEVAQETIRGEYYQALDKVTAKYLLPQKSPLVEETLEPKQALADTISLLQKTCNEAKPEKQRKLRLLIKRMHRLKSELDDFAKAVSDL